MLRHQRMEKIAVIAIIAFAVLFDELADDMVDDHRTRISLLTLTGLFELMTHEFQRDRAGALLNHMVQRALLVFALALRMFAVLMSFHFLTVLSRRALPSAAVLLAFYLFICSLFLLLLAHTLGLTLFLAGLPPEPNDVPFGFLYGVYDWLWLFILLLLSLSRILLRLRFILFLIIILLTTGLLR